LLYVDHVMEALDRAGPKLHNTQERRDHTLAIDVHCSGKTFCFHVQALQDFATWQIRAATRVQSRGRLAVGGGGSPKERAARTPRVATSLVPLAAAEKVLFGEVAFRPRWPHSPIN